MNVRKEFLYIANWKSYFTYYESIAWLKEYDQELRVLAKNNTIVLCPDFLTLTEVKPKTSPVKFGAQTCSSYSSGPYTGEITAKSLSELDVSYCIVGHSERRRLFNETLDETAHKMIMLFRNGIIPILCVSDEYKTELNSIFSKTSDFEGQQFVIAYEPVWAIGTGIVPSSEKIETMVSSIKKEVLQFFSESSFLCLYGGSVTSLIVHELKQIQLLDGFLIGKASTDFQELKKIVEYK